MSAVADWLAAQGAHHDLVSWARSHGDDWRAMWEACPRGDWLLAVAARSGIDRARVAHAAIDVARFGLEDHETPPSAPLDRGEVAIADGRTAGLEEEAMVLERASHTADDPTTAALTLALACALRAYETPSDAAMVPALVAQAAALSAGECAMMAAVSYAHRRSAEIVRARIDVELVVRAVAQAGRAP